MHQRLAGSLADVARNSSSFECPRSEQRSGDTGANCSANQLGRYERGNMVDRDTSKGRGEAARQRHGRIGERSR